MTIAQRVQATRAYLAAAALAGAALIFFAFANLHPVYGVALASIAAIAALWWWRGVFSRRRVLLWLEERLPELRYSLVALSYEPETRFRGALESRVRAASARRGARDRRLEAGGDSAAGLVATQLVARPLLAAPGH